MQNETLPYYKTAFLPILLFCLLVFPLCLNAQNNSFPVAENGIIDLRNTDLATQSVPLNGAWGIYWKKLVYPGDTTHHPQAYIPFPKLWNQSSVNGFDLTPTGYATYFLTVLLPKHSNKLALKVPDTYCSYRLYVNGELLCNAGSPDSTKATSIPKWLEKTEEIARSGDTLQLVLQIANFRHSKGGPYKEIIIGDKETLYLDAEKESAFDLLLTGSMLMGGLFFFGLYLFGKHDKSILYFALFFLSYSYRIAGSQTYVLHSVFPELPWELTVHLEYLTLFISVVFFLKYTRHLYPKDSHKLVSQVIIWLCLGLIAIVLVFPPAIFTLLINPFLLVMFAVIAYAFYVYVKAMQNKRVGAMYALMSTGVVFIVFFIINLQYFGILQAPKGMLFLGYISFFFLQSLILSYRFSFALTQAKLEAEQGLKAKNEFLSTMSHEIRTPLNSILGMTHIILRDNPRTEQKEQLNILLFSANNLLAIVNDILDYNKIEAGKVNFESIAFDLTHVLKNISSGLRTSAEEKGIELKLSIDPVLNGKLIGDPTRLGQIITNLVSNAIKFTRKGYVLLEVKVDQQTSTQFVLTIKVVDTGIGIAAEKQKIVFEQFTQADASTSRNFGGTGLGLAICKKLLALQGVTLRLQSEDGKGSTFYFTQTFPRALTETEIRDDAAETAIPTEESRPLKGISILMAEDNDVNILVARTFLERWGATVDVALNGQQALDMLDLSRHKMVLMDMHMPVMDGYECTRKMRFNGVKIPIVALTASLPREVEDRIIEMGVNDIIVKPFVPENLFRLVLHYTGVFPIMNK